MAYNTLNPRKLSRYQAKIWRSFTWIDLLVIGLLGAVPSIILVVVLAPNFALMFTVGIFPLMFAIIFVIPIPKHNSKIYFMLGRWVVYLFAKRKFNARSAQGLVPYEKVEDGFVRLAKMGSSINNPFTMQTKSKVLAQYLVAFRIDGFNLLTLSEVESHVYIESFRKLIQLTKLPFSLIVRDETSDMEVHKQYLDSLPKDKAGRKIAIEVSQTLLENIVQSGAADERRVYLVFYGVKTELNEALRLITMQLSDMGLTFTQLKTEKEYANLLGLFYLNPSAESFAKIIDTDKHSFKSSGYTMNGNYGRSFAIERFPYAADLGWLFDYTQTPNTLFILSAERYDAAKASKKMDRVVGDLVSDTGKRYSDVARTEQELDLMKSIADSVHKESEILLNTYTFITAMGHDKNALSESVKAVKALSSTTDARLNELLWLQFEAFHAALPKVGSHIKKIVSNEVPSQSLANAFPFHQDSLDDENGMYLGYSRAGSNIFFNPWILNTSRHNHNITTLGKSGSGKSTLVKKLMTQNSMRGAIVICIDPQREYKYLVEQLGGVWLNLGADKNANNSRINPLEFMQESEERSTAATHMQFLDGFFSTLFPSLSPTELSELKSILSKLYQTKLGKKLEHAPKDFPTLKDLSIEVDKAYDATRKIKGDMRENRKIENLYNIAELFRVFQDETAPEYQLWNGSTNFDLSKSDFMVFDIQSLNNSNNSRLVNAQMHLLLKFVMSQIVSNRAFNIKSQSTKRKVLVVVDEAHLLVSSKRPAGLQFLYEMSKTIRKFSGGLLIATQNISDLLGRGEEISSLTSAILNNSQYNFYFNMQSDDIKKLDVANSSSGHRFSEEEINYISTARKGDALFSVSTNDRKMFHVDTPDEELALWKRQGEA